MATLHPEQQTQLDIQLTIEADRHEKALELMERNTKLELIRLAKDILIENSRSKPVDSREVTADDIKAFADTLATYVEK